MQRRATDPAKVGSQEKVEDWSFHGQTTVIPQTHGAFASAYSGPNSLMPRSETKTSFTSTLFLGRSLWHDGELYINPEVAAGSGLSSTHGVAGFPNGEIYRVDSPDPSLNLSRVFISQVFGLGGPKEFIEADKNQLGTSRDISRLTLVGGKFSLNDYFDNNSYSHDPRTQFLNWSLMDNGAWDYAADTRGYTWGFMLEWNERNFAVRFASVLEPKEANQMQFDSHIEKAHGDNLEIEYRYIVSGHHGIIRTLGYMNHAHMGKYSDALAIAPSNPDITAMRAYREKYGVGLNLEQELNAELGTFARLGWNDGKTESWAFTEVDRTASLGFSLKGTHWGRQSDVIGVAGIINELSNEHLNYTKAGGIGFIIGDGALRYSPEKILEIYYSLQLIKSLSLTADYQLVDNPAYNADRGPASIGAARAHYEF